MTCAFDGNQSGGQANLLGAVVDSLAIDVWANSVLCTMKHDERWLAIKSANIISLVYSIVNTAVWRHWLNRWAADLFLERTWDWDDAIGVGREAGITTVAIIFLSFLSITKE